MIEDLSTGIDIKLSVIHSGYFWGVMKHTLAVYNTEY